MEKTKSLALILGVLATSVFVSYLVLAWTEPSSAPPAGNVSAPINVGTGNQIKAGGLGISGGFFVDSPTLVIDAVNDRVGIGTTTPSNMLTVSGSANFTGNVGIGITSPTQKLEVAGSILTTGTGDVCNGAG
ncbi:hypothetical protein KJ636_02240, partial [Patescibacteria group bacterium]|nr:hypothetical protein [Patescibacteria group bacterium]